MKVAAHEPAAIPADVNPSIVTAAGTITGAATTPTTVATAVLEGSGYNDKSLYPKLKVDIFCELTLILSPISLKSS